MKPSVKETIKQWGKSLSGVIFPQVCACCGELVSDSSRVVCDACLHSRFEPDEQDPSILLPEIVAFRFAMWKFDKGGYLQDLLHKLKYDHLAPVGKQLGREAGRRLKKMRWIEFNCPDNLSAVVVPVPLHKSKYRQRGYNQARVISKGLCDISGLNLIKHGSVIRRKKTTTQTGLNSHERIDNLNEAFEVKKTSVLKDSFPIIVDDVYTTGATTFELARVLGKHIKGKAGIVTIART